MKAVAGINHVGYGVSRKNSATFQAVNPATGAALPTLFHEATAEETDEAIRLAAAAFPVYAQWPVRKRIAFMHDIASELEAQREQLIAAFVTESGLPRDRAETELKRTCFQLVSYSNALLNGSVLQPVIDLADPDRKPTPKPDLRKVNTAIGPVVVFGASNFPFAYSTIGGDSASALAAGCPVIVKGHPMHPHTSELVAGIVLETAKRHNLPEGVFSHLHAKGFAVAEQLVKDERIKAVGFTGSFKGGMALHKLAQDREEPIPVFAEMGSVNPIVVLPQALKHSGDAIAEKMTASVGLNAGQFCTSPGLLFMVENADADAFIEKLTDRLSKVPDQVMLNPAIHEQYETAKASQRPGADALVDPSLATNPNSISPAVFSISGTEFLQNDHRQEEVFGSFLLLIRCSDEAEMRACVERLRGQLTASVFTEPGEYDLAAHYLNLLERKVGRVIVNGVPTGVEVSPAMQHGGTFPAATDSRFTSVGAHAVLRFMRPVSYQNVPDELLPESLKRINPLQILRFVNDNWSTGSC